MPGRTLYNSRFRSLGQLTRFMRFLRTQGRSVPLDDLLASGPLRNGSRNLHAGASQETGSISSTSISLVLEHGRAGWCYQAADRSKTCAEAHQGVCQFAQFGPRNQRWPTGIRALYTSDTRGLTEGFNPA